MMISAVRLIWRVLLDKAGQHCFISWSGPEIHKYSLLRVPIAAVVLGP